jgi:hypothetical protein
LQKGNVQGLVIALALLAMAAFAAARRGGRWATMLLAVGASSWRSPSPASSIPVSWW